MDIARAKSEVHQLEVAAVIESAYHAAIGSGGGRMPVEVFAKSINKSSQLVYQWRAGESSPTSVDLILSANILGPDFMNKITAVVGLAGTHRIEGVQLAILPLGAALASSSAASQMAAADGVINHVEAAELVVDYRSMAAQLNEAADTLESVALRGGSIVAIPRAK
ncbi:MAG: hypothetical protein JKY34_07430 [Kordiimonadaceae bacterium]|nr:hypothetical protein [Kordiimonadaceae bacterium]